MTRAPTGSLRKLPSGRWQVRYTDPDHQRHAAPTTFLTKGDARVWLAQTTADISRGTWTPTSDKASVAVTFRAYAQLWVDTRRVKGGQPLSPKTRANYADCLNRHLLPAFGAQRLHTITRDQVESWYDSLDHAPAFRARSYSLLRTILNSAVDEGRLAVNPAKIRGAGGQTGGTRSRLPPRWPTSERWWRPCPPKYRLMVLLAAWCALRLRRGQRVRRGASTPTRASCTSDGRWSTFPSGVHR